MITHNKAKLITLMKSVVCAAVLMMTMNVCEARAFIGVDVGGGYPYYSCEQGYWDNGYWVEGSCGDEGYYSPGYSESFIWGGFGGHRGHYDGHGGGGHGGGGHGGGGHGGGGHGGGGGGHHH